jgi:hypothetical protein
MRDAVISPVSEIAADGSRAGRAKDSSREKRFASERSDATATITILGGAGG